MVELLRPDHLKDFILRPENTEALEDTLYWNSQQFQRISGAKDSLPLNRKIDNRGIANLYHEVTQETRRLLNLDESQVGNVDLTIFDWRFYVKHGAKVGGVLAGGGLALAGTQGGISPDMVLKAAAAFGMIEGFTVAHNYIEMHMLRYSPEKRLIGVADKREPKVADVIADSYDGYILYDKTEGVLASSVGIGHILGVRKAVGESLAQRHDNEAFLYDPLRRLTGALKDVYLFVCKENGTTPKRSLVEADAPTTPPEYIPLFKIGPIHRKWATPTNIGVAVIAVADYKQGSNVYAQIVREDLSPLR